MLALLATLLGAFAWRRSRAK
ncbi:IPTL-CTERM sorting domain-containing protein [Rudaea sp.]